MEIPPYSPASASQKNILSPEQFADPNNPEHTHWLMANKSNPLSPYFDGKPQTATRAVDPRDPTDPSSPLNELYIQWLAANPNHPANPNSPENAEWILARPENVVWFRNNWRELCKGGN